MCIFTLSNVERNIIFMEINKRNEKIGTIIHDLRKKEKETQSELAKAINVSQDSISKIENGHMSLTLENLINIANHYHVSLDYICTGIGHNNILELLTSCIELEYRNHVIGNDNFIYPAMTMNHSFYNYLTHTAQIQHDKNVPDEIKEKWYKYEVDTFFSNKQNEILQDNITLIPVRSKQFFPSDDIQDWKHSDLIREVHNAIRQDTIQTNE